MAIIPSAALRKSVYAVLTKPQRVLPHLKTRGAFYFSGLLKSYANFPHTIYLGISKTCNLKCSMCDLGQGKNTYYYQHLSPASELPLKTWMEFIDDISPYKPAIEFSAAEPLLYSGIKPLISHIKNNGLKLRIFTNGFLLLEFSRFFNEVGLDHLIVSVDGTAKVHDAIRGKPGLWDKIVAGLQALKRPGTKTALVDINMTISNKNHGIIKETFEALKAKCSFDRFTLIHTLFTPAEAVEEHNRLYGKFPAMPICETGVDFSRIDSLNITTQIEELQKSYPGMIRVYPDFSPKLLETWYCRPKEKVGNKRCLFIWNSANITAEGEVIPFMRCAHVSFGNIRDTAFSDIWNNRRFREFRCLSRKVGLFPICNRCSASFMR